jgi:transposase
LEYKSRLSGVRFVVVNPAYTSQTCSSCYYIGTRTNKSFKCKNCGNNMDADANASLNIATLGAVINQPEKSEIYSCAVHF